MCVQGRRRDLFYVCFFCGLFFLAVAVVIERLNLDDVTVAVDGSLYRFHPHFKDLMNSKIAQLVGPQQKVGQ